MIYVALFRNLNLGHAGSPSAPDLVEFFGGQSVATNFQTNGTVVFEPDNATETVNDARAKLDAAGFRQHFTVRPLADLEQLAREAPAVDPDEDVYRLMVSFHDAAHPPQLSLPLRSRDNLVEVRSLHNTHAWSVCWKPRSTAGNVTGFLESLLGVPVTTRTAGTLERLAKKFGSHRK